MTYAERKWEMLRICHERLLDLVGIEKLHSLEQSIHKTGMYLALAYADFRCQDCKRGDKLSMQHLIRKNENKHTDQVRFYRMRHHWQNIIVLCSVCHIKADNLANSEDIFLTLSDDRIKEIKMYFTGGSTINDAPLAVVNDVFKDIKREHMNQSIVDIEKLKEENNKPIKAKKHNKTKVIPYFGNKHILETW